MSVVKDITRGLAPYLVLAGIAGVIWLYRDKIAGWFRSAITEPVTEAVGGVVQAGQQAAETPIVVVGQDSYTVGEAARGWNPLTFIASLPGQVLGVAGNVVGDMLSGGSTESYQPTIAPVLQGTAVPSEADILLQANSQPESAAPVSDTFVSAPQTIPTEADILWQAKVAEVGSPPTSPPPGAWEQRGTSLLGAPLYRPAFGKVGELHYTKDGEYYSGDIWVAGGSSTQYYIVPTGHSLSSGGFKLSTFEAMAERYYGITDYDIVWM